MRLARPAFALTIIASGTLNFAARNFYSPWEPIPAWIPAHTALAYAAGAIMVLFGAGLLVERTAAISARVLFWFLLAFLVVAKAGIVLREPAIEVRWLDLGQIATLVAGALTLAATDDRQLRAARYLLGAALIPIGLSHFFYMRISTTMVPAILPYHEGWVAFTGGAHIAAGLAILAGRWARLAAMLESAMLTAFAVIVWGIPLAAKPLDVTLWIQTVVTLVVAAGVLAVAERIPPRAK